MDTTKLMKRKTFLKLTVPAFLAGLLVPVNPARAAGETFHFQQDPPTDWHYADRFPSAPAFANSGVGFTLDLSTLDPLIKVVSGHLYLQDNGAGRGTWQIETRPSGLTPFPPDVGWQLLHSHYPSGAQVGFQMTARCGNDGKFELKVNRQLATVVEYAFAPIWWIS